MNRKRHRITVATAVLLVLVSAAWLAPAGRAVFGSADGVEPVDVLLRGGLVVDGAGNPWMRKDVGVRGDRIVFVGDAATAGVTAAEAVDVSGLVVAPGFWDVHNHADLGSAHGRRALPLLYQGVTTVIQGVDGNGTAAIGELFAQWSEAGIAVNAAVFVGHGAARGSVMGVADRAPSAAELEQMKAFIDRGMRAGALGLSTGLFYSPGHFAATDEIIELARVAAAYGGVYDTHDRDLGVAHEGIGYHASIREAIAIGERAGVPVIFSHFNAQGVALHGRAQEGAQLIEEARARGVNVVAGQHVYTATHSSLVAYALPRWAVVGGEDEMLRRFRDPATRGRLQREIPAMLAPRGGAAKMLFTDSRPELNGRTLEEVANEWNATIPDAVMRILEGGRTPVMNLDLYDDANTRLLATREWMMTCTDGSVPRDRSGTVHPRSYGAFTKKLRDYVLDDALLSLPFAIRGMTSLAAGFYGFEQRGLIREGQFADVIVLDLARLRDRATYADPHQYAEGAVHVLVNGAFALRDGMPTGALAGRPLPRERGHVR